MSELDLIFLMMMHDKFQPSYSQKLFWPSDQDIQGHSKSNRLVPGLCATIP